MTERLACLIMLGPGGGSVGERFVAGGRLAAAIDLHARLKELDPVGSVEFLVAEAGHRRRLEPRGGDVSASPPETFHFGQALFEWASAHGGQPLAYFGGGSAPLLTVDELAGAIERCLQAEGRYAFVNNAHSTDWALFSELSSAGEFLRTQTVDNGLGWGLRHDCRYRVEAAAPSAGSRCDLDTPMDLIMVKDHPALGTELARFLASWQELEPLYRRAGQLQELLMTPASGLAVFGRSSAAVWTELERRTQIWVRMLAEERGMRASKRLERDQVRSVVGEFAERMGPRGFIEWLEETVDGVLWDTRVWMAGRGGWPPVRERFAFDLGLDEDLRDPELKEWSRAVHEARLPVLAGGHGVVAGGLLALLEAAERRKETDGRSAG